MSRKLMRKTRIVDNIPIDRLLKRIDSPSDLSIFVIRNTKSASQPSKAEIMSRTASPKLANSISGTPPQIRRKRTPRGFSRCGKSTSEHIAPVVQIGFENCRHLLPQRFPVCPGRPTTARLIDLNRGTISGVRNISSTLKKLDISCLALRSIPDEMISTLYYLERIDMSFNLLDDDGIPEKLKELDDLIDFDASHNRLTQLPKVLLKLKKISRLKVGHNQLKSISGIDKLRRLVQLVLEHNQVSYSNLLFTNESTVYD